MQLGEHHQLTADSNGFTLTYEKYGEVNPTTNKPALTRKITYHSTLEQALIAYFKHCVLLFVEANGEIDGLLNFMEETRMFIKTECARLNLNKDSFTKIDSIQ